MSTPPGTEGLTVLGNTVRHPIEHLEAFEIDQPVSRVRLTTNEVVSVCPITGQPDISALVIDYGPDRRCIETKSLKLYVWSFRDRPTFCEALAAEIADEVMQAVNPHSVSVTLTQQPRGGIVIEATATRER